ncbi:hypothetical protein [Pseudomonas sp. PA27(2017)]|uniref:hypothetical protein n=1 Tax=Pseudomonas sp. PA27(2017) TaxID=1932112 RepID=UPI000964013B|nr:hypothetical protein [Pseudomonas sp. PA27(2017)]OLU25158.1 hypothetical protein BVH06_20725 [Pseudomonas sp. PA27(2017)]
MNMISNNLALDTSNRVGFSDRSMGQNQTQSLDDVIKKLVQLLMKAGGGDSGLGQMVNDKLGGQGGQGGGLGGPGGGLGGAGAQGGDLQQLLTKLLEQLIGEKLGKDFGQSQSPAGGGGAPGMGQQGGSNLMDQVLSGLAKSSLDGMLKPETNGQGSTFEQKDAGMMMDVAKFMDANPKQFPPPDAGSWGKELIENKHLDKGETEAFKSAIGMIGQQLDARASGQVPGGGIGQGAQSAQDSLGGTGGLGSPSGAPSQAGGDILKQLSEAIGGVMGELQNLSKKLDMQSLGQGAAEAADSIVNQMLPGGGRQQV